MNSVYMVFCSDLILNGQLNKQLRVVIISIGERTMTISTESFILIYVLLLVACYSGLFLLAYH